MGALRRPVLVALGLRPDGKKEIIDYRLATAESAREWELFLTDRTRSGTSSTRSKTPSATPSRPACTRS